MLRSLPERRNGKRVAQKVKLLIALLAVMVLVGGVVAFAGNSYPEGKCGDPVDYDDFLLAEKADLFGWVDDADEPGDADGFGRSSCINEKK